MCVELLTENHLEFLSLKGGCTGSSESTLAKIPHCWKSHVTAHLVFFFHFSEHWAFCWSGPSATMDYQCCITGAALHDVVG